jgi:predicted N-acyltransferase
LNRQNVSSLHLTFLTTPEWDLLGEMGLLQRTDQQFHWVNDGYASFDDFLDSLTSRKRKAIRKERREAFGTDMEVEWVTGADLSERHWDAFYEFYMDTGARKWGSPYLNRRFFSLIGETMADQLLLVLCHRAGSFIAGALNFIGGDTLYGRYWGCREDHKFLHFELCYYQAIDYAIAHGLGRVEAGAQGPHKLSRGYLPQITLSAHYIADPSLRRAIEQFLSRERAYVEMESQALASHAPYRCGDKPKPGDA